MAVALSATPLWPATSLWPVTPSWRRRTVNALDLLSFVIVLWFIAEPLWRIATRPPAEWVDVLTDDAYYYLGVARQILGTGHSSFLPPFDTNGYQPLWLVLLTATGAVFGHSETALAFECYALCGVMVLAFGAVSRRLYGAAFPAFLVALSYNAVIMQGMETALVPVLFILYMRADGWRLRGLLGAALFLSRVDAAAAVLATEAWRMLEQRRIDLRPLIIPAAVAAVYVAINLALFGVPVPISGIAKSVGAVRGENLPFIVNTYAGMEPGTLVVLVLAIVAHIIAWDKRTLYGREAAIAAFAFLASMFYYGIASGWPVWGWYAWPLVMLKYYMLMEMLGLAMRAGRMKPVARDRSWIRRAALVVPLLVALATVLPGLPRLRREQAPGSLAHGGPPTTFGEMNLVAASWAKSGGLPSGAMIAMGDRAGSFGYFLGPSYRFMHTEGLVGPASYAAALKANRGLDFVRSSGVTHWMADRPLYLETDDVLGLIEPIQPMSARAGPFLVCFAKSGKIWEQQYTWHDHTQRRVVFDAGSERPCPGILRKEFETARNTYGYMRRYLGQEYEWRAR